MQTQEICSLLEQELRVISQKACGSINRVIKNISPECGMSLEGVDVGYSTPGASSSTRKVSVLQSLG